MLQGRINSGPAWPKEGTLARTRLLLACYLKTKAPVEFPVPGRPLVPQPLLSWPHPRPFALMVRPRPVLPPLQRFRKWSRRRGRGRGWGSPCHRKCERPELARLFHAGATCLPPRRAKRPFNCVLELCS